jgi:hypothetical protein
MAVFRIPTHQYRSIASPVGDSKLGVFFSRTATLPDDLYNWRDVNPREVKRKSAIWNAIIQTLREDPDRFHERNRGITIVADTLTYDDKRHEVILELNDHKQHGVVDGAHTLDAIIESQKTPESDGSAYVFIKVLVGIEASQISEIAGGLNTSQQVDLKSLENLREHFSALQETIAGEPYADKVAYKMNEEKPIDVREILYYLAVFDCSEYTANRHPVALFGRKEGIVRTFADQAAKKPESGDSFRILIKKAPEILRLRDEIEKRAVAFPVGRYKAGKNTRVRSESNRDNNLRFLNENVDGKIPLGWIMPMLAGFRANVEWDKPKGSITWIVPIEELLDKCIEPLVRGIQDVHESENSRPEYVGRNAIAWRMSYMVVQQSISEWQLDRERKARRSR